MLDLGTRSSATHRLRLQPYPERQPRHLNAVDQALLGGTETARVWCAGERGRKSSSVTRIEALGGRFKPMSDEDLKACAAALRPQLLRSGKGSAAVEEVFAIVREMTMRKIGLRHYPVQLAGGLVLVAGGLAEMRTGEGKTIVALLPAITMALAGRPVHVVTVNDYLAKRDREMLRPVYESLGITVGLVQAGQTTDERRAAYACDVTYCTNKELVFDYLRDRIANRKVAATGQAAGSVSGEGARHDLLLRGLHFAIVDEADSVLIDEARTPLIISADKDGSGERARFVTALDVARSFEAVRDYRVAAGVQQVELTAAGTATIAELADRFQGVWRSRRAREELVRQAISALALFHRDKHYIVTDGKVQIVDEYTGRVMADRSWEKGLHQLIEIKEGCELSNPRESLAQITYQRFFRRYLRLSGMSGTLREVAGEMRAVYGLRVHKISTNRPLQLQSLGQVLHRTANRKWQAVVTAAEAQAKAGRPVLIGTRSVVASETVSALLEARGTPHVVLNARQDSAEAEAVARAGEGGRITVATNMAGRGTDILLAPGVAALGGLHVILTEFHESTRIDRQLLGRAGRQGDPGSFEAITSLDDDIFTRFAPRLARWLSTSYAEQVPDALARLLQQRAQAAAERYNGRIRRQIVRRDHDLDRAFAFAGRPD